MNILEEANQITQGDRQQSYGTPIDNYTRIANIASVLLEKEITPKDIALIMITTKLAREMNTPKRDNRVDLAGYAWILDELTEE